MRTCATFVALWILASLGLARGGEAMRRVVSASAPLTMLSRFTVRGRLPAEASLSLALGLPLRNRAQLDELLRQLYDPRSSNYHRYLSSAQFTERFGPSVENYRAVIEFAATNNLRVTALHSNRLVLDVAGWAADVEGAFGVTLRTYRHPTEGRDFYSADAAATTPAHIVLDTIAGLSDYWRPRPLFHPSTAAVPLAGTGPSGFYVGNDFRNAYAPGCALNGAGQTVGVLEFSDYFKVDITNYETKIGMIGRVPLTNIVVTTNIPARIYNGEVALDIELAIAMAPGLSRVCVYESGGSDPTSLLSRMAGDNLAKQLSCSWGWESGSNATVDSALQEMAAQGQSFFQASGDLDAFTGLQSLDDTNQQYGPIDSPYLTAVGGVSLAMSGAGVSWASERVWNDHAIGGREANQGSGGGVSAVYQIPDWQTNVDMSANGGSPLWRCVPDVAMPADGIYVYYNNGAGSPLAGTSCSAPLWAGFTALVNQQSVAYTGATVGFLNPGLYAIAASSNYPACFHDVTAGNNIGTNTPGLYNAAAGYDLCTGLGTPRGTNLINALAPAPLPPPQISVLGSAESGAITLQLSGAPSHTYVLQSAADLSTALWQGVATNTLDSSASWQFTGAVTNASQFFRLKFAQ